jgi:hypothetical protein
MITRGQALARKASDSHHEFLRHTFAAALDDVDLCRIMDRISTPALSGPALFHASLADHDSSGRLARRDTRAHRLRWEVGGAGGMSGAAGLVWLMRWVG